MQFRTDIPAVDFGFQLNHQHNVVTMGSCFADEMGAKLNQLKFNVLQNPFGVLFHPLSIENALGRIHSKIEYSEAEIFNFEEAYFSWDHHSNFNDRNVKNVLNKINYSLNLAHQYLKNAEVVLITFGTSWAYKILGTDIIVANCHKVPQRHFEKILLTDSQIKSAIRNCFELIKEINPKAKIITTISPVRHIKDGFVENNLSKGKLITALHEVSSAFEKVHYFPAYEYLLDDLRDYRFYKEDLIHPNAMAVDYIWEKFTSHLFEDQTKQIIKKTTQIDKSLHHKPLHPGTLAYKQFLYQLLKQMTDLEKDLYPNAYSKEIIALKETIKNVD